MSHALIHLGHFVVPVAHDDILRHQIDRPVRTGVAGFPPSVACCLGVEQPVAPHQHLHTFLANQMIVQFVHDLGKQVTHVFAFASRTVLVTDQEHFVHADVERIGFEGIDQFVDQRKDDSCSRRGATDTIRDSRSSCRHAAESRRLVELGILRQQCPRFGTPGLMAQTVHQRDHADAVLAADVDELPGLLLVQAPWLPIPDAT